MILLLGGTSETAPIARALVAENHDVLLSTATALSLRETIPDRVERVVGMMDSAEMACFIRLREIEAVVDATHPYAAAVSENAWAACLKTDIPYFAYDRPAALIDIPDIKRASGHEEGAALACSFGRPVLLTTGVRNLLPYVIAARKKGILLIARVLDHTESVSACLDAGLSRENIVAATGPFSVADNLHLIRKHDIGVLVTKDGGKAGGVENKIVAAKKAGCIIVSIQRPERPRRGVSTIDDLIQAVRQWEENRKR